MASRLVSLVHEVIDGNISPSLAIAQLKDALARAGEPGATEEEAALEDLFSVGREIRQLLDMLGKETSHLRVQDAGGTLVEATRLMIGPELAAAAGLEVGCRLLSLGQPSFAVTWITDAEAVLRAKGRESARFASEVRMQALADLNDWPTLLTAAATAAEIPGDARYHALALRRQAEALLRLGRQDEARPIIERAIDAFDRAPGASSKARDEIELIKFKGEIARSQGDFEAALAAYERAREAALRLQEPRAAAFMLSEIGITWERAGDFARGATVLKDARAEAALLGDWRAVLRWGGEVESEKLPVADLTASTLFAYAARKMGEPDPDYEAIRTLALRCIEEAKALKLAEFEAQSRNLLAAVYEELARPHQAMAAIDVAIDLAHTIDNPSLELTFRINRMRLRIAQSRFEDAEAELPIIFALADHLLDDADSSELRQTIRVALARACEYGVICASIEWTAVNGAGRHDRDPDAWIAVSQRGQAQNLTSWIALGNAADQLGDAAFAQAVRQVRAADISLERLAISGGVLTQAVTAQQQELTRFQAAAAAIGQPTNPRTPGLTRGEIEAGAPRDSCVLALYPLKDSVAFAAFSGGSPGACGRIAWTEVEREAWLVRWDLAHAAARTAIMAAGDATRGWRLVSDRSAAGAITPDTGRSSETLEQLAEEFQVRLLEPLRARLGHTAHRRRLIVVPHVNLSMLPFWRWAEADPDAAVSLVPSLGCLTLLGARDRPLAGSWIKCGDATGTLLMVARELAALTRHQLVPPALDSVVAALPSASVVHFAGHGYFNRPRPYDSGLVLGAPQAPAAFVRDPWEGSHAMLTVSGIVSDVQLPRCFLATLSACCTGVPRRHAASEFTSLPAALLVAGARNVIASLWPAHDGATALLMEELYRDMPADDGAWSPSAALARARRTIADMPRAAALERLASEDLVPPGERPFASPLFTMTFQHYGVD